MSKSLWERGEMSGTCLLPPLPTRFLPTISPPLRADGFQFLSSCYWTWFSRGVFLLRISSPSAMEDLKSGFDTLTEPHPEELVEGGGKSGSSKTCMVLG
jgi:hypothetical protein